MTESSPDLAFSVVARSVAVNNVFGKFFLFAFVPSIIKAFVLENVENKLQKTCRNIIFE